MTASLQRLEFWRRPRCNSGDRIAEVPLLSCRTSERLDGEVATTELRAQVPAEWILPPQNTRMLSHLVAILFRADDTYDEFWLDTLDLSAGTEERLSLRGLGMLYTLARRNAVVSESLSGKVQTRIVRRATVSTLLGEVLGFAPSYFSLGTVTPTDTVEVTWDGLTPLAAARAVVAAVNQISDTQYVLSARRNGVTGYFLDCTALHASLDPVDLRTGRNVRSAALEQLGPEFASRVVVIGTDGRGIGDNQWAVVAVSLNTYIEVEGIDGGPSPLAFGPGLTGKYWVDQSNGKHEITNSEIISATRARLSMSSTSGISVGHWGRIALNSSGDELVYLDNPLESVRTGVVTVRRSSRVAGATNWFLNPDCRDGTATTPTGWSSAGTPARQTAVGTWVSGGASYLLAGTGGEGVSQTRTVLFAFTGWCTYTVRLRVEVYSDTAHGILQFRNPQTAATENVEYTQPGAHPLGQWVEISRSYQITSVGAKTILVNTTLGAGSIVGQVSVDSIQFTMTPEPVPFVRGSGGAQLIQETVRVLQAAADPLRFRVQVTDRYRQDPARWPDDALLLGRPTRLTAEGITHPVTAAKTFDAGRLVAIERDELLPEQTDIQLGTPRPTLTAELVG